MGAGKTLQTITCILDNLPKVRDQRESHTPTTMRMSNILICAFALQLQHAKPGAKHPPSSPDLEALQKEEALWDQVLGDCHHDLKMANVPESVLKIKKKKGMAPIGVRAGTLVVVPVIAIYQWQEEIAKFTVENTLSVCIYHGSDRQAKFPREILCKYDIILTTYQVLEADFRKMISPNKVTCPNCGRYVVVKVRLKKIVGGLKKSQHFLVATFQQSLQKIQN
jgi:DNA-directed RNA polymerase subunit RPC12/RpoP